MRLFSWYVNYIITQTCTVCGASGEGVREITLRHDLHALSAMFDYSIRHNWARRNPVKEVEIPSDANAVRIHVVTRAEELAYFTRATKRPNLHDVAKLILLQGMRPEEVLRLRPEDVDLERGTLRIARGKTKAARRALKLRADAIEILARRVAADTEWLFPGKIPDRPISKLNNPHDRTLREAGVSFVLYDLRHTFATRAAEAAVPLATLAAILGHNNLRSVIKYVHPSEADQFRAIDRLDTVPLAPEPVQPAQSRWAN
jgi:integrase